MNVLEVADNAVLTRVSDSATAGSTGDLLIWAPNRRPIVAEGPPSVLWAMLESPGSIQEIAEVVAQEFGSELGQALEVVRSNAIYLWHAGVMIIEGTAQPEAASEFQMAPSH